MPGLKYWDGTAWQLLVGGGIGVPPGGTTGQVLTKTTGADYNVGWSSPAQITVSDTGSIDMTLAGNDISGVVKNGSVTNAMLANITGPKFKGLSTATTGPPEDFDVTTATSILNPFVAAGGTSKKGLVPDPGGTVHTPPWYLCEDGSFRMPRGTIIGQQTIPGQESTSSTAASAIGANPVINFFAEVNNIQLLFFCAAGYTNSTQYATGVLSAFVAGIGT